MGMPGRRFSAGRGYRYGFNGKENDNEVKGEGNQQDYGMRIYDTRLGRFLSIDPITGEYPELTPYQFASNRTIDGIDLDGLEHFNYNGTIIVHDNIPRVNHVGVTDLSGYKAAYPIMPANIKVKIIAQWKVMAPPKNQKATIGVGGYKASPDWQIRKARVDTYGQFLPGISDIMDVKQAFEHGIKGEYGQMALSLASLVPGADFITKPLKFGGKYVDEAAGLIKTSGVRKGKREIEVLTKSGLRTDAYKVTSGVLGDLGDDAIPLMGKSTSKYPDADKIVVGMQSADGKRGWRIDFDSEKGAHYNWFNNETGEKGAVFFEGTQDQVHYLKQQMTKSY